MISPASRRSYPPSDLDAALGYGLLWLTLGLDFLFHSYSRWRDGGKFAEGVVGDFAHTPLPVWSMCAFATVIPHWEPVVGLLARPGIIETLGAGCWIVAHRVVDPGHGPVCGILGVERATRPRAGLFRPAAVPHRA